MKIKLLRTLILTDGINEFYLEEGKIYDVSDYWGSNFPKEDVSIILEVKK